MTPVLTGLDEEEEGRLLVDGNREVVDLLRALGRIELVLLRVDKLLDVGVRVLPHRDRAARAHLRVDEAGRIRLMVREVEVYSRRLVDTVVGSQAQARPEDGNGHRPGSRT